MSASSSSNDVNSIAIRNQSSAPALTNNNAPPMESSAPLVAPQYQIIVAFIEEVDINEQDNVPTTAMEGALELQIQKVMMSSVLKLASCLPNMRGAGRIQAANKSLMPSDREGAERFNRVQLGLQSLLVTNTPSAVEALEMEHNLDRVKGAQRIIIQLYLDADGNDYSEHSVKYWEDYVGGSEGDEANLSQALLKCDYFEEQYDEFIREPGEEDLPREETLYYRRAKGTGLVDMLLRIFNTARGTKRLVFIVTRKIEYQRGLATVRRIAVSPNPDACQDGRAPDLATKIIQDLSVLQGRDAPLQILMQGDVRERTKVGGFIAEKTGHSVEIVELVGAQVHPRMLTPVGAMDLGVTMSFP
ncbi:hypothetical protein FGRMN_4167 [Fusarium graminum]|nr:hypothetical protein FGRMN_4167 [Fusarium graminum]